MVLWLIKRSDLEIILIAVLVIAVIAFIAYPLFSTAREKIAGKANALDALVAQRDSTYDAIHDLDFDFQLGKLSQDDYAALRDKYKARAAQVLQQIDAVGGVSTVDAEAQIEVQVARLRRAKTDAVEDEIARVRAAHKAGGEFCAKCGTPHQPGDQFCAKCGNRLATKG